MNVLSAVNLECLLYLYYTGEPAEVVNAFLRVNKAREESVSRLTFFGLAKVKKDGNSVVITALGQAHVKQILELPFPKKSTVYTGVNGVILGPAE